MKYVKSLDGVRGLAIVLVFLFHYVVPFEFGWVGVQLFFVLSGYLITSILLEDKGVDLATYLKRFYWRRTLRIFPIYYAYLFLVSMIYFFKNSPIDFLDRAPYLFSYSYNFYSLVSNFENDVYFLHFWSLSIEEQFYLFWPLIVYFTSISRLKVVLVGMLVVAPAFRFLFSAYLLKEGMYEVDIIGQIVYRMTPSQLDSFALGAMIPVFNLRTIRANIQIRYLMGSLLALLVFGFLNYMDTYGMPFSSLGYSIGGMNNLQHVWSYTVIGLVSMFLVLVCVSNSSRVANVLFENTLIVYLGSLSYGLYIYHWVISMIYRVFFSEFFLEPFGFIAYSSTCVIISILSYKFLESPFLSLKDRFFSRPQSIVSK